MATRKNIRAALEAAMEKLSVQVPKHSRGPITYTDQEIINLAQDYATAKIEPRVPKARRTRITGKWWEIGTVSQEEVTDKQSERLQYYFDLASEPNPGANYWVLYFNELARHGGDNWSADDWRKWRIWYFSMHPEQRTVYQSNKRSREQERSRKRWAEMTPEQRERRNATRRRRAAEKRQK